MRSFKKTDLRQIGRSRGGKTTKLHMIAADAENPIQFRLTAGNFNDGRAFWEFFKIIKFPDSLHYLILDQAYEGNETREEICTRGFEPVVPPKANRGDKWKYNKDT